MSEPVSPAALVDELVHAINASLHALRLAVTTAADGSYDSEEDAELRERMLVLADRESRVIAGALGSLPAVVEAVVEDSAPSDVAVAELVDSAVAATVRRGGRVTADGCPDATVRTRARAARAALVACCLTASDDGARIEFEETPADVTVRVEPVGASSSLRLPVARVVAKRLDVVLSETARGVALQLERS